MGPGGVTAAAVGIPWLPPRQLVLLPHLPQCGYSSVGGCPWGFCSEPGARMPGRGTAAPRGQTVRTGEGPAPVLRLVWAASDCRGGGE